MMKRLLLHILNLIIIVFIIGKLFMNIHNEITLFTLSLFMTCFMLCFIGMLDIINIRKTVEK